MSDPQRGRRVASDAFTQLTADIDDDRFAGIPADALVAHRRDEHQMLLAGRPADALSGLAPARRLGPYRNRAGIDIWFDVFAATRRLEVRAGGVTAPALVLTAARPPVVTPRTTTVDVGPGTVWVRGDLLDAALPADAYVGVRVRAGALRLAGAATVTGDVVEFGAPLEGSVRLEPEPDDPTARGSVLPEALTLWFRSGGSRVEGAGGRAEVWGRVFDLPGPTGARTFLEPLWTLVLEYDVDPRTLDPAAADTELVRYAGKGRVTGAGLGLPVVVAPDPAILGAAAVTPHWCLRVSGLTARWYGPDSRPHELGDAWLTVAGTAVTVFAEQVAPLSVPVTHEFDLWAISDGGGQRLPWRQRYDDTFLFHHRCHVADGEQLMVTGRADLAVDRPVTSDGRPVVTPTGGSVLLLRHTAGTVTARLGATVAGGPAVHQFALRNALVWTTAPTLVIVDGTLVDARRIDAGTAQLLLQAYAWAPILPDPYVSNVSVRRPRIGREPRTPLLCRVTWTAPEAVAVSFAGLLAGNLAVGGRTASPGGSRPVPAPDGAPDVGLTQVEQGTLTFDRAGAAAWRTARTAEERGRGQRVEVARREDERSLAIVDNYLTEFLGPAPGLTLLDVSTNQDLLGVAVGDRSDGPAPAGAFPVDGLAVRSEVARMRVVALPQHQWEPVRTLDEDQDLVTLGWFPTPLAAAGDGGATQVGARSQRLMPIIPEDALHGTVEAHRDGETVAVRTTFPFGLIAAIRLQPQETPDRRADLYGLTRPEFPEVASRGGIQITAQAEGSRPDDGGVSPTFAGRMRQLLNGVDLASGGPLGLSVLGATAGSGGSVETVFNNDMAARPRVPVTRIDLSGYGGSNFSDWNNPFAAFSEAAKVQFRVLLGRTALEVVKVNSVLHPWGIRVTRSVTIERRPGGGVIRRDSGWQAFTPGLFDYRYFDTAAGDIVVAPYGFDAGLFRGLFDVRTIRPAPGAEFAHGGARFVPYYFDADVALDGRAGRTPARGVLGYLQTAPNGVPAGADALRALIEAQGPIGGPVDTWLDLGGSGLPFRAQRVEVGVAMAGTDPLFVATVRGVPKLPTTGAWSVVTRPVAAVPPGGGEAVPVADSRGVPVVRRYPIAYPADDSLHAEPPLAGVPGPYRFADAADLLTPAAPANDYALLQSTPTHAFLFPRPSVPAAGTARIEAGVQPALADILARSTSKGAFPPPANTIELTGGPHLDVGPGGELALSAPIEVVNHPTPLRLSGTPGHGSSLFYDSATLRLDLRFDRWDVDFTGLRIWSDIAGLAGLTGSQWHVVGGSDRRPQIAELTSLLLPEIEEILRYIPTFGARGSQGPVDLGASNAKHEIKISVRVGKTIPPTTAVFPAGSGVKLTLSITQSAGVDLATGGAKASAAFGAELEGKVPLFTVGAAAAFLVVSGKVSFSLSSVNGVIDSEQLELTAFVGIGVEGTIGPFKAYAFLGIGFVLVYDAIADTTKYGGLVAMEAGVDLEIVKVKIRAELKGLVYKADGVTKCDYSGSVKIQVDIFLFLSISATYQVTETAELGS
ncbi:hypothetical protein [Polymorphospora lycopeni]|uniref:Uncharacterized protein n=1 Tax=Polymorphospora lycopeni TaxID=3140240 RepID=A0ABV5CTC7_9ACTN